MKVQIVKYLNPKGKVVEMRKDNFKGRDLPENIIEEYEIEIKGKDSNETERLEDLKRKYESGNYILLTPNDSNGWVIVQKPLWDCDNYVLIHNKHKDILEAYLKNPSVEIECTNYISKDADIETIWYLEKDFIEEYNEDFWYRLKVEDLAWYEDENNFPCLMYNPTENYFHLISHFKKPNILWNPSQYLYTDRLGDWRPATESEVLSLVYKPQQKISKENILAESDRLKDLFLKNEAECLVENEQEFNEVYDFLDKTCDKKFFRYYFYDYMPKNKKMFPIFINFSGRWDNLYEWKTLEERNNIKNISLYKDKPLIKYSNEIFSLVEQGGEI